MSDRHQKRLVVGSTRHGADTVVTSRQTASDSGSQLSLSVASIIDTLEEGELGGIRGRGRSQGVANILDGDVSVANDRAATAELLGRCVVRAVRVREGAQLHVLDLYGNVKVLVGCGLLAGDRASDDGSRHLAARRHLTHHNTVAGPALYLKTVGQRLARTEVDEVGIVCDRLGLARRSALRAILLRACLYGLGVQSETATAICCSSVAYWIMDVSSSTRHRIGELRPAACADLGAEA